MESAVNGTLLPPADASARIIDDGRIGGGASGKRWSNLIAQRDGVDTTVAETRTLLARLDAALADFDAAW